MMNVLLLILAGWAFMAIVMTLLWLLQKRTGDAGIVDIAWGMGVGILAAFFCWMTDDGLVLRRVIITVLAMAWAVRLSGYVLVRVLRMPEDGRYKTLKENWGTSSQKNLFLFYQFQAFGSVLFALPMLIAAHNAKPFGLIDVLAILVWCIAIGGESIADRQLHRFRTDPDNRGKVCRNGLWGWSRHPNYFFEWVHWWTYVLFAILAPFGWLTVLFPMAMLYFILFKTGIPPTEQQSIKSRGDAYREYQRTTSAFFPFPPRS